jgi:ketosteroid isomerase-like protein
MPSRSRSSLAKTAAVVVAASLCAAGCGSSRERRERLNSLVRAEQAFASACSVQGTRSGFLSYLAADAVVFRPRPVNGAEWYARSADSGGRLAWEPLYADVSGSGNLGYTTGPWTFSREGDGVLGHGTYVSVWKREAGGEWKVVIDIGVLHAAPDPAGALSGPPLFAPPGAASKSDSAGGKAERRRLSDASQRFFRAWSAGGMEAAYGETASEDVLTLRSGERPARAKSEALHMVRSDTIPRSIEAMGGDLAASGDLGYTYGVLGWGSGSGGAGREASYLWVWKRSRDGKWEIVVDVMVSFDAGQESGG